MSETPDQYVFLKVEFKKVDIKNATEVKKWFTTYDYLTVYDHAFIMERCTRYVRELKIFAGLKGKRPTTRTRSSNRKNQGYHYHENGYTIEFRLKFWRGILHRRRHVEDHDALKDQAHKVACNTEVQKTNKKCQDQ